MGSAHPSLVPYQNFRCGDDRWVFIAAGNDRLWRRLADALERPDLATDERFLRNIDRVRNRTLLEDTIQACLKRSSAEDVVERCRKAGVPVSYVNSVADTLKDPQIGFASTIRPTEHPELGTIDVVGLPVAFSAIAGLPNAPAPGHGQDTREILEKFGMDDQEINELCGQGVVFCGDRTPA